MLDISGCTHIGYIRMYSCWIYPDVLMLDISGCTHVGYVIAKVPLKKQLADIQTPLPN